MDRSREPPYKRIALYTALILTTLAVAFVTYRLSQVVLLFVLSIILAAALHVPMLRLQQWRLPRGFAILLLYILILGTLSIGIYLFGPSLGAEVTRASVRLPQLYTSTIAAWQASSQPWQQAIARALPNASEVLATIAENGTIIGYQLAGLTYGAFSIVISVVAVLTLSFYWLLDENRFLNLWLTLLPIHQRTFARQAWSDIDHRVGLFVCSESVRFVLTFVLLWFGLRALGVAYPTIWALYGAIAQLIPWIGVPLMVLPALPMFLTDPLLVALGTIALIVAVGFFIHRIVDAWIGVSDIVHPIISVLALLLLGEAAGILGMIVALPLAATLQGILSQILQINAEPRTIAQSASSSQIQALRARLAELEKQLPADQNRRPALDGMIHRINALLDKTERLTQQYASSPQHRRMLDSSDQTSQVPSIFAMTNTDKHEDY